LTGINPKYEDTAIIKAYEIALRLHEGQFRKSGEPYIIHPIAVAKILAGFGMDNETVIAGLLHDVVEDTNWTFKDLEHEGVPSDIIEILKLLTHDKTTDYYDYVQHIIDSGNITAINVKRNDLTHNIARGRAFGYEKLIKKHSKALEMIEAIQQ
jgi:GTP pyrophosphokinase